MTELSLLRDLDRHYRLGDASATRALTALFGSPRGALLHAGDLRLQAVERLAPVVTDSAALEWECGALDFERDAEGRFRRLLDHLNATTDRSSRLAVNRANAQLDNLRRQVARDRNVAGGGLTSATSDRLQALATAYAAAVADVRATGASPSFHQFSDPRLTPVVVEAARVLPAWLVNTASAAAPLGVVAAGKRASYDDTFGVLSQLFGEPAAIVDRAASNRAHQMIQPLPDGRFAVTSLEVSTASSRPAGCDWARNTATVIANAYRGLVSETAFPAGTVWVRAKRALVPAPVIGIDKHPGAIAGQAAGSASAFHEVGHWLESKVAGLGAAAVDWRDSRASGGTVWLDKSRSESALRGDFPFGYVGKEYEEASNGNPSTEVLSCALPALFAGEAGGLVGWSHAAKADRGMRAWALGVICAIGIDDENSA